MSLAFRTLTCCLYLCSEEDVGDTAVEMEDSPSLDRSVPVDVPKVVEMEVSTEQLLKELSDAVGRQVSLVAQLKGRYVGDSSHISQKDKEIASLKAQLAEAQEKVEAAGSDAKKCDDSLIRLFPYSLCISKLGCYKITAC